MVTMKPFAQINLNTDLLSYGQKYGKYVADEHGGPVCFKKPARCHWDHGSDDCWET